jgi:hypothetical protein
MAAAVEARRNKIERCQHRRLELMEQLSKAQLQLFKDAFDAGCRMAPLLIPALIRAREELGIPLEVTEYTRHSEELMQRVKDAVSASMQQVDQILTRQKAHDEGGNE